MSADVSRRPSNERVRVQPINATIIVQCRGCLGDGWHYPRWGAPRWKAKCIECDGTGRREIMLIAKRDSDIVLRGEGS